MSKYTLIVTEKPAAANKIALALADGKPIKESSNGVPYYKVTHGKEDIIVACAVGHLFGLAEREKKSWSFPVFDIEWKPVSETSKTSAFTKKYLNVIKKLAKGADKFVVATDYDVEGEVIGLNVIRYVCKQKDAFRMKFSTLTKPDLIKAYEKKSPQLDWGQAKAGETRHFLDWYNGINYSRALTHAIKTTGSFKLMSTGRVQGPALKILVDKEKEIKKFKSVPFWQLSLNGNVKEEDIEAWHEKDKFWELKEAESALKNAQKKEAGITKVESKKFNQQPPFPFDLTSLQVEAYRALKIQPKTTLSIAQELYTAGAISYPRTSSQKLPENVGYRKILSELKKNGNYKALAEKLLSKKSLKPNEGKKSDPAHPAIFPTGQPPTNHEEHELKVYDLIVKRFLATFSEPAKRETNLIHLDCGGEGFITKGTRTIEKGWHEFYQPYLNLEEQELPKVEKGDSIAVSKVEKHDKETQPPKRYTPASIIKELEKRSLGTKATRSEIIDTLFKRGYVDGKSIQATELGIHTLTTLEKYAPKIVDEELTRHFEEEMERIREGKTEPEKVLGRAKTELSNIIDDFKKHEKDIGKELYKANKETRDEMTGLGGCPKCKEGELHIRRGKFGPFVACNKYPKCKTTFSLPKNALIKPAKKQCEECDFPLVLVVKRKTRPQEFCLNQECSTKDVSKEEEKKAEAAIDKPCPTCKKGKLVMRSSLYGHFIGCSQYPKCKHTEKITEDRSEKE